VHSISFPLIKDKYYLQEKAAEATSKKKKRGKKPKPEEQEGMPQRQHCPSAKVSPLSLSLVSPLFSLSAYLWCLLFDTSLNTMMHSAWITKMLNETHCH
jgi:hypothetical protein